MPGYNSATNQYTLGGTSYDANGNLLNDTLHKYSWDAENRLLSVDSNTCGVDGTCLTNDAFGQAVEENASGVYSEILYSPLGKTAIMSARTATTIYVPMPGGTSYTIGATNDFWHKDWQGSVRLASTRTNRTIDYDRAFAPFGESYNNVGSTTGFDFTGDTQDIVVGTYDTPGRELNRTQGRWISPDPAGHSAIDMINPQSWNRYAYVLNNPLGLIDPSGLACIYLNDAGNGVDSIDNSSGQGECGGNGGYWIEGFVNSAASLSIDSENGTVSGLGIDSHGNAELSIAGAAGSNAWGVWTQTFGSGVPLGTMNGSPAANNSWGWNFTKAFFGGLVSSAGWKAVYHSFGEGGCDRLMAETFAEDFNPLGSAPGVSDAAELGPKTIAQAGRTAASVYSLYQGLSVPLRSSIYRGLQSSTYGLAATAEEAVPYLQLGGATVHAVGAAGVAAYNGECH